MFPVSPRIPVLQMTLALVLALFLAPVLVLAMALVLAVTLVEALVLVLALVLPLTLSLVQMVAMTLSSAPPISQASETSGQSWSLIVPPGITTATGNLGNNPGNFCKSQNLVPEGTGRPPRLKGTVRFSVKHCHGATAFSTTGRRRYCFDLLPFPEDCPQFLGGGSSL